MIEPVLMTVALVVSAPIWIPGIVMIGGLVVYTTFFLIGFIIGGVVQLFTTARNLIRRAKGKSPVDLPSWFKSWISSQKVERGDFSNQTYVFEQQPA
jgi:hypothetical protein